MRRILRASWTALRLWWRARRTSVKTSTKRETTTTRSRTATVLTLSGGATLGLVAVRDGGVVPLPDVHATQLGETRGRARVGTFPMASLLVARGCVPSHVRPADLGCDHVVVERPDGARLLYRENDDMLPLLRT